MEERYLEFIESATKEEIKELIRALEEQQNPVLNDLISSLSSLVR